jgi:hypothetical protein
MPRWCVCFYATTVVKCYCLLEDGRMRSKRVAILIFNNFALRRMGMYVLTQNFQ